MASYTTYIRSTVLTCWVASLLRLYSQWWKFFRILRNIGLTWKENRHLPKMSPGKLTCSTYSYLKWKCQSECEGTWLGEGKFIFLILCNLLGAHFKCIQKIKKKHQFSHSFDVMWTLQTSTQRYIHKNPYRNHLGKIPEFSGRFILPKVSGPLDAQRGISLCQDGDERCKRKVMHQHLPRAN